MKHESDHVEAWLSEDLNACGAPQVNANFKESENFVSLVVTENFRPFFNNKLVQYLNIF